MDSQRVVWGIIAYIGLSFPIIGMIIGFIRYKKYSDKIKEEVKRDYDDAQKKGGLSSLYYKHTHKRIFAKTFGIPILAGLIIGLVIMLVAFYNL